MEPDLTHSFTELLERIIEQLPLFFIFLLVMILIHILTKILLKRIQAIVLSEARTRSQRPEEFEKRTNTLVMIMNKFILVLVWMIGLIVFMGSLGISTSPFVAAFGVLGLALGFGAQNMVRDIISGIFILAENQIRVGDQAIINGTSGLVEAINLRTVVLRDVQGVVHIFPSGAINSLSNRTKEWSAFVFDLGVAYGEDVDHVMKTIREVGSEMEEDEEYGPLILEPIEIFGLDQFGNSELVIKGRFKCMPGHQWYLGREFNRRIKIAFDNKGIEIPFPHTSLEFSSGSRPLEFIMQKEENKEKDSTS